jgi:hypothetical protein
MYMLEMQLQMSDFKFDGITELKSNSYKDLA